jgi:hypothetical protein
MKYSLALSTGYLSLFDILITYLYDLYNDALIPSGGSNTNLNVYLIKVRGTLGLNSIVKNSLKLGLGLFNLCIFFSISYNHYGAK